MKKKLSYPIVLFIIFAIIWIWMAISPSYRFDWFLENLLVIPFVIFMVWSYEKFRFSNISYTCMFFFMVLHVIGAHYTYSEVPFGYWISGLFGATRNHFDRIVHLSYGLLFAYPVREIFLRIASTKGAWGYYLPVELTLAMSCIYELIEWGAASIVNPEAGMSFLGTQGDEWDAQKDMALAGLGSVIAMTVTALINSMYKKDFFKEIVDSFKVKRKTPLGEREIKRMKKRK